MVFDRRLLSDVGLAVLLALPTALLARPSVDVSHQRAAASALQLELADADRSAIQSRFSFPG